MEDGRAYPIAVRICSDNDVCSDFSCQLYPQLQSILILRIRRAYSQKVPIRLFLAFYDMDISKAAAFQYFPHRNIPCAMNRRVHDFKISHIPLQCGLFIYFFNKKIYRILPQTGKQLFTAGTWNMGKIRNIFYITRKHIGITRHQLPPIRPVNFVSVIFLRIMTGSNDDPACRTKMPDRKRKNRDWFRLCEKFYRNPCCAKNMSRFRGKISGVISGVISDNHPVLTPFPISILQVIRKSFCRFPYIVPIHAV